MRIPNTANRRLGHTHRGNIMAESTLIGLFILGLSTLAISQLAFSVKGQLNSFQQSLAPHSKTIAKNPAGAGIPESQPSPATPGTLLGDPLTNPRLGAPGIPPTATPGKADEPSPIVPGIISAEPGTNPKGFTPTVEVAGARGNVKKVPDTEQPQKDPGPQQKPNPGKVGKPNNENPSDPSVSGTGQPSDAGNPIVDDPFQTAGSNGDVLRPAFTGGVRRPAPAALVGD